MLWFLASYCALFSIQFSLQYYLLWMLLSIHHWALFPMPAMCSCALLCCTWWACSCCCCCLVVTYCGAPVSDVCLLESSCNLRCWHHPLLYADVVPFCVCASIVLSASFPCLHWTSLFVAGVLLVSSKMFVHFYQQVLLYSEKLRSVHNYLWHCAALSCYDVIPLFVKKPLHASVCRTLFFS